MGTEEPKRRRRVGKVSLQEKILFAKHLAIAIKSGMPLIDGLRLIRDQSKSKSMRIILDDVLQSVTRGVFLSESLAKYQDVFGNLFVNMLKIAEASGTLPENLNYLAQELKKKYEIKKRVRGAMMYPIVIFVMTIAIAVGMILFVFPKILPLFQSLNVELPFTTRILIAVSKFLTNYGLAALPVLIAAAFGLRFLLRMPAARFLWHRTLLKLPIFGKAVVHYNMANLTRTFAILLRSGVQIVDAAKITAQSLSNLVYERELAKAAQEVTGGAFLSRYLKQRPQYFPEILANMIEVGENTGNLVENLFYLGEYYEGELDDFVKNLSGILEPILLLFMGGIVGFIALSFITPMYQLTKGFR